jgi:hypothetical protein
MTSEKASPRITRKHASGARKPPPRDARTPRSARGFCLFMRGVVSRIPRWLLGMTPVGKRLLHMQEVPASKARSTLISSFRSPSDIRRTGRRIDVPDAQRMLSTLTYVFGLDHITR